MLDYQRVSVTVFAVPNRYKTCGEHPNTTAEIGQGHSLQGVYGRVFRI